MRIARSISVLGMLIAASLALSVASASALSKHAFSTSFAGSGANALSGPSAVTVDQQSHDVYVTDPANHRVEKFSPTGEFILMLGRGVDATTGGDVCAAESGDECQAGVSGADAGAFVDPNSLAVDNSAGGQGDLYVGDFVTGEGSGDVQKFDSEGNLIASWAQGGLLDGSANPDHTSFAGNTNGNGLTSIAVDLQGNLFVFSSRRFFEFGANGAFIRDANKFRHEIRPGVTFGVNLDVSGLAVDSSGSIYAAGQNEGVVRKTSLESPFPGAFAGEGLELGAIVQSPSDQFTGIALEPASRDVFLAVRSGKVEHFAGSCDFVRASEPCPLVESFGEGELSSPEGIAVDDATNTVYVADSGDQRVAVFGATPYLPNATASAKTPSTSGEMLEGSADPAGAGDIGGCRFEYVTDAAFDEDGYATATSALCSPSASVGSPFATPTPVSAALSGLAYGTTYHFQLVAENANGSGSSFDQTFTTLPQAPLVGAESVSAVRADSALIRAQITPGGGDATYHTTYHVEYLGTEQLQQNEEEGEEEFAHASQSPSLDAGSARVAQSLNASLSGLNEGTTYRYRVVAENASSTTNGTPQTFTTLPSGSLIDDPCENAHVRQQTGAVGLLDCRAYELTSAANTGGYDVESSLVPGQTPYAGYPEAEGKVLYGIHSGGIPGTGSPTNRGVDPYVATRGEDGWSTEYVGIPAAGTPSDAPFSSTVAGTDAKLETFAFGGPSICSPCFADASTGVPLHEPNGDLIQGMTGSEDPGPTAKASEAVAKPLSANGEHLVFASTSRFEPDGNEGEVSIYDRNLKTGTTHVVSKTPAEATMTGPGIAELDISKDGSHILIGQLLSEAEGDKHWHLYMNVGDSHKTIDLTPGTTTGALYAGMSSDGSKVFFTTKDQLLPAEDEDESADLYAAEFGEDSYGLRLVSTGTGGTGNSDSCNPVANSAHVHWNSKGEEADCGVLAIGGGGGVAAGDGTVYFLSPEKLDGSANGTEDAPNLYVVHPDSAPHYVSTLESVTTGPQPPKLRRSFDHDFGSFSGATAIAVDHQSGDAYVLDAAANTVEKFDSAGSLVTSFGDTTPVPDGHLSGRETKAGSFSELFLGFLSPTQLAVDQSNGDLYVPDIEHEVVDKFSPSGELLFEIKEVSAPSAVAVDPANGDLYVSHAFGGVSVFDPSGNPVAQLPVGGPLASVAVDAAGSVYATQFGGGTNVYDAAGHLKGTLDPSSSQSVTVDPSSGDVYVDEGARIVQFDSASRQLGTLGAGVLSGSVGVTIDPEGSLYATTESGAKVAVFTASLAPNPQIDNPMVVDSVSEPSVRHSADFQLTPGGTYAAFGSTVALGGGEEEAVGHSEVYRYGAEDGKLSCVSCQPTGAVSEGDGALAPDGLSLTDDGRVFFDSTDQLASADTDAKQDVYEFSEPGVGDCSSQSPSFDRAPGICLALISAGTSSFDSGLLSASSNGKDAFFFTRDSLAPQDKNGATMKVYDAREGGGFPFTPEPNSCQASDECHGAASAAPGPINAGSTAGAPGNAISEKKPHKKKHKKASHKHRRHHSKANQKRGGAK